MKRALVIIFLTQIVWSSAQRCTNGKQLFKRGIQQADQIKIVQKHNVLRNEVARGAVPTQSPAQDMRTIVWDNELAVQAQKWADNCKFEHDPNLKNSRGEPVGQNLAISYTTNKNDVNSPNFEGLIQMWFDEVKKHGYQNNGQFQYNSGHYSQMIWAKTNKIGCGYTAYQDSRYVSLYLVCNYHTAGNFIGQKAYVEGRRNCRARGLTDSSRFSDLCN